MSVAGTHAVPEWDAGRFGQFSFTSFDGQGGAGWQVKETRGLTQPEVDLLRGGVDAQLDAGVDLPRFPSPIELDAFPRRLVFEGNLEGYADVAMAWWHHAPAGLDGSGRPGNVFIHALLDRGTGGPVDPSGDHPVDPWSHRRPVDWWRGGQWLSPYGPEAVRDSALPAEPPGPGTAIGPGQVVEFLLDLDDYRRLSVLRVLLDACAAAMAGGPRVVLATESTDRAARWIASVSYLASAATAKRLSFSTLERPGSLANRFRQGVLLCCAPLQDHPRLADPGRDYVLLADDRDLITGDLDGEPHRTAAGDPVRVTEWSVLARALLRDEPTAAWAIDQIDAIGSAAPPTPWLPAWPLAMLVAAHTDAFADVIPAARRVIPNTPDGADPDQLLAARTFIEGLDLTVDEAWQMLAAAVDVGKPSDPRPDPVELAGMAEQVLGIYVTLVVRDVDRLGRHGGPPLPDATLRSDGWITDSVTSAIEVTVDELTQRWDDERSPAALLGLATLAWRLGLLGRLTDQLTRAAEIVLWPRIASPGAAEFVASLGPVPDQVLSAVVRGAALEEVVNRVPGTALDHPVLAWLYPRRPSSPGSVDDRLRVEYAYQSWFTDPGEAAGERALALAGALVYWQSRRTGPNPAELAERFADPPWTAEEILSVEGVAPRLLPLTFYGPAVKASPTGPALNRLIHALEERSSVAYLQPYGVGALSELRRLSQRKWWTDGELQIRVDHVLCGGIAGLAYPAVPFDSDGLQSLQIAMLTATGLGIHLDDVEKLLGRSTAKRTSAIPGVAAALEQAVGGGLSLAHLAVAAMLGETRFPAHSLQRTAHVWAAGIMVDRQGERVPILQACALDRAERNDVSVGRAYELVRGRLSWLLTQARADQFERGSAEKYALGWLKSNLPGVGWFGRRR